MLLTTESYRELFTAVATCSAGLTGLLFVAISVAPRDGRPGQPAVIHHVRAASALVAFINALSVSLFGLVPGNSAGKAAIALGAVGILFTAASVRSIVTSHDVSAKQAWRQAGLVVLLLAAFGAELGCGIGVTFNRTAVFGPELLGDVLIAMLLIGIARAWELVGARDTGILSSLAVLAGRPAPSDVRDAGDRPRDAGDRPRDADNQNRDADNPNRDADNPNRDTAGPAGVSSPATPPPA